MNLNKIVIQPFTNEYKTQVIDLIVGIQSGEFGVKITAEDQPDLKNIYHYYQEGMGNFWIALDKGKVVGTIALLDIENHQVALRKMFVAKSYRGKPLNIAQELVHTAKVSCQSHKVTHLYLGTVPSYLAAHRFYEKNGFIRINESELPENFPIMEVDKIFYKLDLLETPT